MMRHYSLFFTLIMACFTVMSANVALLAVSRQAQAVTYYLSPTGDDGNPGTSSRPWLTFPWAISSGTNPNRLRAGDTLILKDGTYTNAVNGWLYIDSAKGANRGLAGSPITVKAEHERQALLLGDGSSDTLYANNTSYWTFEGLRVESADRDNGPGQAWGDCVFGYNSDHLVFRRLLIQRNNRFYNTHALLLYSSRHCLIEECEVYNFHRHGIIFNDGNYNTVRRCYVSCRYPGNLPGAENYGVKPCPHCGSLTHWPYPHTGGGSDGYACYMGGSHNVFENNIGEKNDNDMSIAPREYRSDYNRIYGHISLYSLYPAVWKIRNDDESGDEARQPHHNLAENWLVLGAASHTLPFYVRGNEDARIKHITRIGGIYGIFADSGDYPFPPPFSTFVENSAIMGLSGTGFAFSGQTDWSLDSCNSYSNGTNWEPPASDPHITNHFSVDPGWRSANYTWVSDGSSLNAPGLHGKGKHGADIGANILYRYQDGVLTSVPLWDPKTGAFPHSAIVKGVNDLPGASAFDVHKRLNVNPETLPAGYGKTMRHGK